MSNEQKIVWGAVAVVVVLILVWMVWPVTPPLVVPPPTTP